MRTSALYIKMCFVPKNTFSQRLHSLHSERFAALKYLFLFEAGKKKDIIYLST